jgi:hypothetical protein
MKLTSYIAALAVCLSCSSPKLHIPSPFEKQAIIKSAEEISLTPSKIKSAEDYCYEFPDESIINEKVKVVVDYKINEEYDSTLYYKKYLAENRKADSLARIEKKKYRNSKTPELTEHPIPDGEVFVNSKYEIEYTNIKDFVEEPIVLHYNSMKSLKSIHFKVDNNSISLDKKDESFDGSEYFKTDSRYLIYDLNLPVRGSNVFYEYTEECRDAKFQSTYYIPEEHFTIKKIIKIAMPEYLEYEIIEKNFNGLTYTKDTVEEYSDFASTKNKIKYLVYTFRRLKPFTSYPLDRGPSYDYPMLYIRFKSTKLNGKEHNIIKNTDDLYSWYKLVSSSMTNDTSVFADFTRNLVKGLKTDDEKIKKVFYWIQDNIRYLAFEDGIAGFRPDECSEVFNKRYGDCKGMANLTKNMLRVLGYDSRLVWIGTKHQNFSYDEPGMPVDNHAICAVKLKGKYIFLDGTETFIPMYDYANRIQGRRCIVEDGDKYSIETIPEWGYEHNEENIRENIRLDDLDLIVETNKTFKGESKLNLIRAYNYIRSQKKDEVLYNYLTFNDNNFVASNIKNTDLSNRDIDPVLSYDLRVKDRVYKQGKNTYINIDWEREFDNLPHDSTRTSDLDLGHKNYVNKLTTIYLKDGQRAVNLPSSIHIENEYYTFILEIKQIGNKLIYKKILYNNKDFIPASMLKNFEKDCILLNKFYNTYIQIQQN